MYTAGAVFILTIFTFSCATNARSLKGQTGNHSVGKPAAAAAATATDSPAATAASAVGISIYLYSSAATAAANSTPGDRVIPKIASHVAHLGFLVKCY
jgi:hypothetical protein